MIACDIPVAEELIDGAAPSGDRLRAYVEARLTEAGYGAARAELVNHRVCANSVLWEFTFRGDQASENVLVKLPRTKPLGAAPAAAKNATAIPRYRLFDQLDPVDRARREFAALQRIYKHFQASGHSYTGALRVFDFDDRTGAILMQKLAAPSLKQILAKQHRFGSLRRRSELATSFRRAGEWLRRFHEIPQGDDTESRHLDCDALPNSLHGFRNYLAETLGKSTLPKSWVDEAAEIAVQVLPGIPESAVAHCDYAPRNVLIDSTGRTVALDTAACWRAPIYMDLAYFLVSIKAMRAQIYSGGLAFNYNALTSYETEFLTGYFGSRSIPWRVIRLFELQALLDRWAAMTERIAVPANRDLWSRRAARALQQRAMNAFFRARAAHLLQGVR